MPDAGVFALIPDRNAGVVRMVTIGVIVGTVVFGGYIRVWRHERLYSEKALHLEIMGWYSLRSVEEERRRLLIRL